MNKQYNIVWNSARNMYVVASEFACGDSRIKSQVRAGGLVAALIFASSASYAVDNTFIAETGKVNTISGSYTGTSTAISAIGTGTIVEDSGAININVDNINNHTSFYGISVGKNAQLILDNPDNVVTINSEGSADAAIYINSNASASINGGTYNASGAEVYGIYLQGSGSLDLKNAVVNASGTKYSFGVYVWGQGSSTTLDNDILNTTGEASSALRFSDATGTLTANNITLTTQGLGSYALLNVQGTIDLNDLTITTSGYDATGIYSSDKTTASDVNITTTGEKSHGAEVANGALTLNGGTVQASGTDAYGLLVTTGSMAISDLDVSSAQSYGVALQNGTTTSATNSNVKGTGAGYYLDKTSGSAATALTVDGGSVTSTTEGGSAFQVNAGVANINVKNLKSVNADNLLTVNNTTDAVTFTAENSQLSGAVNAGGNNASMALDNASQWMMTGDSNVGNLTSSGRITLGDENGNRGTLNAGNLTLQSGSTTDVWVSTSATAAPITADNASLGGTLNITGFAGSEDPSKIATATVIDANSAISGDFSKITIAGMENADFLSLDGHINSVDNTQYDVSTSLSWFANSDDAHGTFTIDDANENFTIDTVLDDQTANPATGWDGESLIKEGDGTLIMDAENTYSGDTHVNDGTLWVTDEGAIGVEGSDQTIYVAEGATFGGDNGTANANVINDGTVKFDDTLTINGDMTNSGTIASGDVTGDSATSGNTLVINGDYIANDGKLIINTELGDDSSPTDMLVVNGDTSGNTTVYINNTGGEGAQTDKGIKIIDVNGASNGEFTQGNQVQVNAFEYRMYKDEGDYYLRSTSSGGGVPQYRADIGAYLGNQSIVQSLQQQTLFDREGSQFRSDNGSMWARFKAGENNSTAAGGNVDIDGSYSQFQIGSDIAAWSNGEQSLTAGVMGSYINAKTDSTGNEGADGSQFTADGKVDGYNVGLYATWFADAKQHSGAYLDSWYQYGIYSNSVDNGDAGTTDYDSNAHAVSLEAGYRYDLGTVSLTPQAQVIWQKYTADSVKDKSGTQIDGQNSNSLNTRLGLRVDSKMAKSQDAVIQPFAEVNWLHASDDASVTFGDTEIAQDLPADRAELKVGIQANVNKQWSITAQAAGQKGSDDYSDVSGSLNVRYSW